MTTVTTKTYATRDSATALLKKMGVTRYDYNLFIRKEADKFIVNVSAAQAWCSELYSTTPAAVEPAVEVVAEPADEAQAGIDHATSAGEPVESEPAPKAKKVRAPKAAKEPKSPRVTVASRARELILEGKQNAEVFAILQAEFAIGDEKKHYPAWYRSELKRKGTITETKQVTGEAF